MRKIKLSTDKTMKAPFVWECDKCKAHHEYQFGYCPNCGEKVTSLTIIERTSNKWPDEEEE